LASQENINPVGSPFVSERTGLQTLVLATAGWKDEYLEVIHSERVQALAIRVPDDGLSFLGRLTELRGLTLSAGSVRQLATLEALTELEDLTLNTLHRPKMPVDFGAFSKLKRLGIYWNPGFESVFACEQLQSLFMFGPPDADLTRFGGLQGLRRLEFSEGRRLRSLDGADQL